MERSGDTDHVDPTQVPDISAGTEEIPRPDPAQVKKHFDRIGHFRILVTGRSNSGKTTLLQGVYNTTELPGKFNTKGEKVCISITHSQIIDVQQFSD